MSTYNENLRATVVDSLHDQELDQKKINSQLTASMFTLYYAEGARITAAEKLDNAKEKLDKKTDVKVQAVHNSNHSTNLLLSANQGKAYMDQSVTNTAVSAANVQVASNAILRLSSDMGSIYSIVSAADFDEEIYEKSKGAYNLMNLTAYKAEKTSQHAMEASASTAEVSMSTVANKAKNTNTAIEDVLKIAETEFNATSQIVAQDNIKLAEASTKEKKAEGILEDVNVEFAATNIAYKKMNAELNINLNVPPEEIKPNGFRVKFDAIKAPFSPFYSGDNTDPNFITLKPPIGYPVKTYNIFIVKDKNKGTFSLSEAQNLMKKTGKYHHKINAARKRYETEVKVDISIHNFLDSDGDFVKRGQKYVVFVMAEYLEMYKKTISDFEDFLSASSSTFTITYKLKEIAKSSFDKDRKRYMKDHLQDPETISVFTFSKTTDENFGMNVDYRCMFIPADDKLIDDLLTVSGLNRIEEETKRLEEIANHFNPEIAKAERAYNAAMLAFNKVDEQIKKLKGKIDRIEYDIEVLDMSISIALSDNDLVKVAQLEKEREIAKNRGLIEFKKMVDKEPDWLVKDFAKIEAIAILDSLNQDKKKALAKIDSIKDKKRGLFFNLEIAEEVPVGNFIKANTFEKNDTTGRTFYVALIKDNTTDNYGNPLELGKKYVPVVLSYSTAKEENLAQFTNAVSDYINTDSKTIIEKEQ